MHRGLPRLEELRRAEAEALVISPSFEISSPQPPVCFAQSFISQDTTKSRFFQTGSFWVLRRGPAAACACRWRGFAERSHCSNLCLENSKCSLRSYPRAKLRTAVTSLRADRVCLPRTSPADGSSPGSISSACRQGEGDVRKAQRLGGRQVQATREQ